MNKREIMPNEALKAKFAGRGTSGYEVIRAKTYNYDIFNEKEYAEIVIAYNPKNSVTPYVVWHCYNGNNYCFGHYYEQYKDALICYYKLLNEEYDNIAVKYKILADKFQYNIDESEVTFR